MSLQVLFYKSKSNWKGNFDSKFIQNLNKKTLSHYMIQPSIHGKSSNEEEAPLYASASMTLEAAMALPIFIFFVVAMLFLFRVLQIQQNVEEALEYAARQTAISAHMLKGEDTEESMILMGQASVQLLGELERLDTPVQYVENGLAGFSLLDSSTEGSYVELRTEYTIRNPISFLGLFTYRIQQCAKCHKWIGNVEGGDDGGQLVYITDTGTAYHLSRDCTYLALSIRGIPKALVESERNLSGNKYRACERCQKAHALSSGIVYVTDYGDAYHSSLSCSGLKRTIYVVQLEGLTGYHACSKCAQ